MNFERARLIKCGRKRLAEKIEHTSLIRGDGVGFDIHSFEESGQDRLIEVKTTKYGGETPFFVSQNELAVSRELRESFHLYRLFRFRVSPKLFILEGELSTTCDLAAVSYQATVRAIQ